ncbi:MAG TPA: GNAT family N-acetyltransferase [Flavitalea sp.]|nr:GNAT family N-acetyltransferase [Flavitalea sp.]
MILKPATELHEFLQIHQLNYKTFVEEIPQHQQNMEKKLVDKFHDKNKYIVAMKGEQVIGMVCYNSDRPFSLDTKIYNLDQYLPEHTTLVEIRLLSVCHDERKATVAYRLLQYLCQTLIQQNVDAAVISGTTRQLRLYSRMGFTPFGPPVGNTGALYQPMYITLRNLRYDFKNN